MEFNLVKLMSDFCGHDELIVRLPKTWADEHIKERFEDIMGYPFGENCSYEILEG